MSEELLQTETMADLEEHFDDANPWNIIADYLEKKTVLPVKIEGIVNGGVIAIVEGIRGFIPASQLSLSYVENLEDYLLKDIEVQVIEADQAANRLILSAKSWISQARSHPLCAEYCSQTLYTEKSSAVINGIAGFTTVSGPCWIIC